MTDGDKDTLDHIETFLKGCRLKIIAVIPDFGLKMPYPTFIVFQFNLKEKEGILAENIYKLVISVYDHLFLDVRIHSD